MAERLHRQSWWFVVAAGLLALATFGADSPALQTVVFVLFGSALVPVVVGSMRRRTISVALGGSLLMLMALTTTAALVRAAGHGRP
ncbi:MAG TPA: hypothetical protein VGM78_14345, partial [Ilumatobacteraceae bacterium]